MDALLRNLAFLDDNEVRIGVLSGSTTSDSEGKAAGDRKAEDKVDRMGARGARTQGDMTQAEVFAAHELGLGVPKRSSLGWVMDNERPEIEKISARVSRLVFEGKMDGETALGFVGERIIALVQKRIRDRIPPELSPATLEQKTRADGMQADIPLILFGQYIRSFRWNIVETR